MNGLGAREIDAAPEQTGNVLTMAQSNDQRSTLHKDTIEATSSPSFSLAFQDEIHLAVNSQLIDSKNFNCKIL